MRSSSPPIAPGALTNARLSWVVVALLAVQALLWIGAPSLFEGSIRLDVAEGAVYGPEWQLSYFRHPPFSSWLTGIAAGMGPWRYGAVYAIGFALASGAFAMAAAFVARLDRPAAGLVALIAGLTSPYATYVPLQVNHNIGLMPFWAMTLAAFWFAFEEGTLGGWALLGACVGLGLWAKYALLHLLVPLALLALTIPDWRRRLTTPGPWLALLLAAAIFAPQAFDVLRKGATTLSFATRTLPAPFATRLLWLGEFALDAALAQVTMAIVVTSACGAPATWAALRAVVSPRSATRLDVYLLVAALGPVAVILTAAPLGVHPHYLWVTAPALGFAAWWGHLAGRAGLLAAPPRLWAAAGALAALLLVGYVGMREIAPRVERHAPYPDMDGPALASRAQLYWAQHASGPIPYIVSFGEQHGLQAAGSIVFDLPYRARMLEDGDRRYAPYLDPADMRRRGALVVSTLPLGPGAQALGVVIREVEAVPRPMARGAVTESIWFGLLPPGS